MAKLSEKELPEEAHYETLDVESEGVKRLLAYLIEEHRMALAAHDDYFAELKIFRRAIKAKPAVKVKTFPWPGASNLVVPLIRITGDAVKARVTNTLLSPKPFFVVQATSSTYDAYAKPWEKFLEWAVRNDLDIENTIDAIGDQIVYLGKCPVKIHWREERKKVRTYNRRTSKQTIELRTMKDQPMITPILLENWLEPWGLEESNEKPWNSHRTFLRAGDLIEREKQGLAKNAQKVIDKVLSQLPPDIQEADELRKRSWAETKVLTFYETHVQFDIDNDGFREEIIVLWNYEYQIVVRAMYNFFFHGHRPMEMLYYYQDSFDRSSGDGLAHLLYPLQDAMSTFINQRSDNITIANTRFFKAKRNAGIKKGESVWPGKVFLLDDPTSDLVADKLGEVSPSSFTHESILRDYSERLSGISDPQLGREFNNPRVAATTTLSVLQEGNRRFDMVIRLLRAQFAKIGIRVSQLYQQFGPRAKLSEILSPEDEVYVAEILSMAPEEIEKNFLLQVNISTATVNKESQRQGLLALFNLITQFYGQVIQVAEQIMANPQFPEPIKDMVIEMSQSSYNTLKEIVASYDITDPSTFLVDVGKALEFVRAGGSPSTMEGQIQSGLEQFSAATQPGVAAVQQEDAAQQAVAQPGAQPVEAGVAQ